MENMFGFCHSLKSINFSNFNTENATNMDSIFIGCESVTNLNLSNFNTKMLLALVLYLKDVILSKA